MAFPVPVLTITSLRLAALVTGLGLFAASPLASAVTVSIGNADLSWGGGYGVDASEKDSKDSKPTLLDVSFASSFSPRSFSFDNPGDAFVMEIASVNLSELNEHGGITDDESDDLDVWWAFALGGVSPISLHADAVAFTGAISDQAVDYALYWEPVEVDLGTLGQFSISLNDLQFDGSGSMRQMLTITMLAGSSAAPEPDYRVLETPLSVPEPGSMALIALGLAGIGATRLKKSGAA